MSRAFDYRTATDIDRFFDERLKHVYQASQVIAQDRLRAMAKRILSFGLVAGGALVMLNIQLPLVLRVLVGGACAWGFRRLRDAKSLMLQAEGADPAFFKKEGVRELARFVHPMLDFHPSAPPMSAEYEASRLFPAHHDYLEVEDCTAGTWQGIEFAAMEMRSGTYREETVTRNGRKETLRTREPIFEGLFFVADTSRKFEGWVTVHTDRLEKALGWLAPELQRLRHGRELALMDHPEFERGHVVTASDQVLARYLLPPQVMDRILELEKALEAPLLFSFSGSVVRVALARPGNLFEFQMGSEPAWREATHRFAMEFRTILALLECFCAGGPSSAPGASAEPAQAGGGLEPA